MRRDYFVFGDVNSLDYDVWFTGARTEDTPAKKVSAVSVAGRNGNLLMEQKQWDNVDVTYSVAILHDFSSQYGSLIAAIASQTGYCRLEDSVRTEEYRLAAFHQPVQPQNTPYNKAGQFDLLFNCKPQRFLKSGEWPVSFDAAGTLYNPTRFTAQPMITVLGSGSGKVYVGGTTVEIKAIEDQIILDCELMDAYREVGDGAKENKNSSISAPEFPVLQPGENTINWDGGITGLEIIPRWWTL